ncbi:MAG: type II toxin-antitoxin system RelE/ParE family toxin [Burkholderiales bacterium]
MKSTIWLGDSLDRVRRFPAPARRDLGYQLELVQAGKEPRDWKPIPSIGPGVSELRAQVGGAFRVIYLTRMHDAVYVLHAFQKKTRKTGRLDLELARRRLKNLLGVTRQS